jgi:methionyl-tRNA formyltransferase
MYAEKICIAGKNQIAIDAVDYILDLGIDVDNIYACTNKTDSGENNWQPSLLNYCTRKGIKVVPLEDLYLIENLFFFSLEFDLIISTKYFLTDKLFNIHFSELPKYKGMYTSVFPILNNEEKSGVTLHEIDFGIDTGNIIDQISFPITDLTSIELYYKYQTEGIKLFKNNFKSIIEGNYKVKPQERFQSSYFSKKSIQFNNLELNANQTAFQIRLQIQAYRFRPYQLLKWKEVNLSHSEILDTRSNLKPGTIINKTDNSITLSTIDFDIVLYFDNINEILIACENDDIESLNELINQGYYINDFNYRGWTPLMVACYNGSKKCTLKLIEIGADVNAVNFKGTTVLMYSMSASVQSGDIRIMKTLIENGADINKKDYSGRSIFYYAQKYNDFNVNELLNKTV